MVTEDMIVLITLNRTKKVLVVSPRNFVVVRMIKREKNGNMSEF